MGRKEIAAKFGISPKKVSEIAPQKIRKNTTEEERAAIHAAYANGKSVSDIALDFDRSRDCIRIILRDVRPRIDRNAVVNEVIKRFLSGEPHSAIYHALGINSHRYYEILRRNGLSAGVAEHKPFNADLDKLSPKDNFPKQDNFELEPQDRDRLEEIRRAKIRNYHRLVEKGQDNEIRFEDE